MIYTPKMMMAVRFSIRTHEIYQKQKRKGKDVAYITHPLTVGMILARAGADEDVIIAGTLHDTIEDSIKEKKVTRELLEKKFGARVANIVESVTEDITIKSWEEKKRQALEHVEHFSHESLLVKSADVIANGAELIDDYAKGGEPIFARFGAGKKRMLENQLAVIAAILAKWKGNPLSPDLNELAKNLIHMLG